MHDDTITLSKYSCGDSSLLTYIYGENAISPSSSLDPPSQLGLPWPTKQPDDVYFNLKS
jgi:hypothetical protein